MNNELNFPENLYSEEVNSAKTKLGDIVRETFLTLSEEEKEAGTTTEQKNSRYVKWYRPMIDEIMASVTAGDQDLIRKINDFDLNKASHKEGNSYYSEDEAFMRDVEYKLLPELYEIVQDKIRKDYDKKKIPYIVMFSSESPVFPTENKIYTVKEFNELLLRTDSEFHNRREYAYKKYGSADNYRKLESEGKLPEEDKGIQFGYDKTNFKFFNIPNPANPEDTFSYEPSRYDIGDGNGSVFDYVCSTCSHDVFIEALNQLEKDLYFPEVTKTQREDIDKLVATEAKKLSKNLTEKMAAVDEAQEKYRELHKKLMIGSSEAEAADKKLKDSLSGVKAVYDNAMSDAFAKILNEYPNESIYSQLLQYAANDVKKMAINELYLPSRNAQKAMNAKDYASYNSTDWAKLRKIWGLFPVNVNMDAYVNNTLKNVLNFEKHFYYNKSAKEFCVLEYNFKNKDVGDIIFYNDNLKIISHDEGLSPAPSNLQDALYSVLEMRYNFNFDPDGMTQSEYEAKCDKLTKLYPENWIEIDKEQFEQSLEYAEKGLHYGIHSTDSSVDFTEFKSFDDCIKWVKSLKRELENDNARYIEVNDLFNPSDDNIVFYENVEWKDGKSNIDNIIRNMETNKNEENPGFKNVLDICEKIIPKGQFEFTKELMQGEEGEFFAKKLTELSERCKKFTTDEELVNEDGTHEIAFHYFGGSTDIFLTQIYENGTGFGYTILNGDVEMSEWGYTSLEDLRGTNLELDYHIPEGKTVEQALYEIDSDYFKKPKTKEDIINEAGDSFVKKVKKELKKGGKMPEVVAGVLSDMKLNKPEDYKNVKAFLDSKGVFKSENDFISFCKKTFEPKKNNEISGVGR